MRRAFSADLMDRFAALVISVAGLGGSNTSNLALQYLISAPFTVLYYASQTSFTRTGLPAQC